MLTCCLAFTVTMLLCCCTYADDKPAKPTSREALRAFNDLIGTWRGTGIPEGTREEKQKDFWTETVTWDWQFKGDDCWLRMVIDKGKYFKHGELRYLPEKEHFQLSLDTIDKATLVFTGQLKDGRLTLDRTDDKTGESQRLVLTLLHANRYLFRYDVKAADKSDFTRKYQVGCTKEGEDFATGDGKPECVVSGGLGTIPVTFKGQTYYVCCGGCRAAFKENPEKYLKEYEERKARKK